MKCIFDENELEYNTCERPPCNHVICPKHEEHMRVSEAIIDEDCPFSAEELDLLDMD